MANQWPFLGHYGNLSKFYQLSVQSFIESTIVQPITGVLFNVLLQVSVNQRYILIIIQHYDIYQLCNFIPVFSIRISRRFGKSKTFYKMLYQYIYISLYPTLPVYLNLPIMWVIPVVCSSRLLEVLANPMFHMNISILVFYTIFFFILRLFKF